MDYPCFFSIFFNNSNKKLVSLLAELSLKWAIKFHFEAYWVVSVSEKNPIIDGSTGAAVADAV